MENSGNCWDRFEHKTLLTFTGYRERAVRILSELDRVGMSSVNVQWQFPSPFDGAILRHIKHEVGRGLDNDIRFMSCTMGHYRAIKTAFHLGCKSVMVMEDDIRFLKDLDKISAAVHSVPDNYDIAMFDLFPAKGTKASVVSSWRDSRKVNDFWAEFDNMYSMGCYAMSRRAMERYIWLNEAAVTKPSIGMMRVCDHFIDRNYFWPDAHMYFARTNVAVQRADDNSNSKRERILASYSRIGIEMSAYAE